jgi:hypothetical protein
MSLIPSESTDGEPARATDVQYPASTWRFDPQEYQKTVAVPSTTVGISSQNGYGFLDSNGTPPTKYDVLLGRGKFVQHHKGNIRLHNIINSFISRYIRGDKRSKTQVSADILNLIRFNEGRSGRFLKFDNRTKTWTEVDDSTARQKVGHAIRDSLRAPVLRERKSKMNNIVRGSSNKRNLEEDKGGQEDAEQSIHRDLSVEDIASLQQRHDIKLPLPAARTDGDVSTSSGNSTDDDNDNNFSSRNDTLRCPVIPKGTRDMMAEDASSLLGDATRQAPPIMYPICTSTRNVVGQIVNLQDVSPDLLASSRSFVTFLSKMKEEGEEE